MKNKIKFMKKLLALLLVVLFGVSCSQKINKNYLYPPKKISKKA
jgi:energy-converting hydrogenase Eha subunit F